MKIEKIINSKLFKQITSDDEQNTIKNHIIPFAEETLPHIKTFLPEYTLHDVKHSYRILEIIEDIIPSNVELNDVEIVILLYAVFLHDIGMVSSEKEKKIITGQEKANTGFDKNYKEQKENYLQYILDNGEDENTYSNFVRTTHVQRSLYEIDFIAQSEKLKIPFSYKDVDIKENVKAVVKSHGLSIHHLKEYETADLIKNFDVNTQYLSFLLRLGDLLESDITRTPKYITYFLDFNDKKSKLKWLKSQKQRGKKITVNQLKFKYSDVNADEEREIRKYIDFIESQIKQTREILDGKSHYIQLPPHVELQITNDGSYLSANREITLDYHNIIHLLMGTELYENEDMFIRELIQNSRDACKLMEFYQKGSGNKNYKPRIDIFFNKKENQLVVKDNGIGMDDEVVDKYLINVGKSSYGEIKESFYKRYGFHQISNFGIGILSCFMVSDYIQIQSRKYSFSSNQKKPINIFLNVNQKYVVDKRIDPTAVTEGTQVTLTLHSAKAKQFSVKKFREIIQGFISWDFDVDIYFNKSKTRSKITREKFYNEKQDILIDNDIYTLIIKDSIYASYGKFFFQQNILIHSQSYWKSTYSEEDMLFYDFYQEHGLKIENVFLNIKGPQKFTLKASRNSLVKNSDYDKLNEMIVSEILKYIDQNYPKDKRNRFFSNGISTTNKRVVKLLKKVLFFRVKSENDHILLNYNEIIDLAAKQDVIIYNSNYDSLNYNILKNPNTIYINGEENHLHILEHLLKSDKHKFDYIVDETEEIMFIARRIQIFNTANHFKNPQLKIFLIDDLSQENTLLFRLVSNSLDIEKLNDLSGFFDVRESIESRISTHWDSDFIKKPSGDPKLINKFTKGVITQKIIDDLNRGITADEEVQKELEKNGIKDLKITKNHFYEYYLSEEF